MKTDTSWFVDARYGMFVHYGLYSLLERGAIKTPAACRERVQSRFHDVRRIGGNKLLTLLPQRYRTLCVQRV